MQTRQGWSILHTAAINGRPSCCSVILQFQPNIGMKNHAGWTALDFACQSGDMNTVRILMDHGAEISFDNAGNTALHRATEYKHPDVVEMLVLGYQWNVNTVSTLLFNFF